MESAGTYAGNNPQQTEYVQVSDTIEGLYSKEVKADNCYIAFFFVGGASSSYYYGFTATDTVGTYTDDQAAANITDNYILSDGVLADLNAGNLVYTPAVTEDIEVIPEDVEGALVFVPGYAQDGVINNKVKISGAMSIDIDIDFNTFKNFGFGLMSTYGDSSPYSSNLLFASKTGAFTPWGDKLVSEANAKYIDGYVIEGRVTLTLDISADGDATLYA
ncbi:MAG: hypothetical protein IKC36_00525, partial [Clostridia bacterium]|nr:hypothetical protein [Clostridia bacterium]